MSLGVAGGRHAQAFFGSLGRLARSPLATFMTLLVIAVALALPARLRLFVSNAQSATGKFAIAVDQSLLFKTQVPLAKAQQLAQAARQRADVASVTLIPADKGLEDFRTYSGFGDALPALTDHPRPHVLHVRPRSEASSAAALESLRRYFAAWPEVELVQVDSEWVLRFNAVGGSNAYVRRPFLYTGVLYGLSGALLAWGIVALGVLVLGDAVGNLARLYGSRYVLQGLTREDVGVLLGAGVMLGWLGAWISAARHLRRIEPRA